MIQTRPIFLRPTHINSGVNREGFALCGINNLGGSFEREASSTVVRKELRDDSGLRVEFFFYLFGTFFAQTFWNSTWIRSVCSGATILAEINFEKTAIFNLIIQKVRLSIVTCEIDVFCHVVFIFFIDYWNRQIEH